jgi:flagellar biosynthesis anti-sigma factor FlgM
MIRGYDLASLSPALDTNPGGEAGERASQPDSAAMAGAIRRGGHTALSLAASLMQRTGGGPEVRSEKVAAIQAAIASGAYEVSASQIAGKLIESMLLDSNR